MKRDPDQLDPFVTFAFSVVRYLSQISEALALHPGRVKLPDDSDTFDNLAVIATCADRAEHIAQDFASEVIGGWSAKRTFIQRQLRADLEYMLFLVDVPYFHAALMQSKAAYPTKEQLQTLLAAVDHAGSTLNEDGSYHVRPERLGHLPEGR